MIIIIIIIIIMGRFSGSALHRPPPADGRRARAHRRVACSRPAPYCQPERYTFPSSCLAAWLPGCLSVHVYMYDVWYTVYDVRNVHTHTHTHTSNEYAQIYTLRYQHMYISGPCSSPRQHTYLYVSTSLRSQNVSITPPAGWHFDQQEPAETTRVHAIRCAGAQGPIARGAGQLDG